MNGKHKYELCSGLIFLIQYWNTILLRVFALMNEKKNMYDIHTVYTDHPDQTVSVLLIGGEEKLLL